MVYLLKMVIYWDLTTNLVMTFTVRHGISMALEIDGLPFLIAW